MRDLGQARRLGTDNIGLGIVLDVLQLDDLAADDERVGFARTSGAACPSNPVHIIFLILGQVVIDDDLNVIDVNASRRNIRRHQQIDLARAETVHDPRPQRLFHITMQRLRRVTTRRQFFTDLIDFALGVAEHKRQFDPLRFDQAAQDLELV